MQQYGNEKREGLNRLEKKLYSRNAPDIIDTGRSDLKSGNEDGEEALTGGEDKSWQSFKTDKFDELAANVSRMAINKHSFVKKVFVFSVLFFVLASAIAAFVFFGGMNIVSSKNVDIKVVGPVSIGGGQEVSLDINVINNNNTNLESVSLLIEYPEGTRNITDLSKEISNERFTLGQIKSGDDYNQNIKVVFFGEKESVKEVKISLEYRVENSSALFYKEKVYEVSISSAPVVVTATYPKEVNSNQEMTFNVEVASNSKDVINDFLVKVEYPFGFVYKSVTPDAFYENNVWKFSNLKPGEKKNISIKGNIIGQDNEEKVFRINVGTANENDERAIAVPFSELVESILVKKSFIGLEIFIDGREGNYVGQGGSPVNTNFVVRNNLPSRLFNITVEASLKGGAFSQASVAPNNNGFFQSFNNTILWDKRSVSNLSDMDPGAREEFSFRLTPLQYSNIAKGLKPEVEMVIKVSAERILESGSAEQVSATETRKIVLASNVSLSSTAVRSIGDIENSGPVPPRVNVPTTYTVVWGVSNSFNQASNVEVRATLPPYVKWTNLKSPQSEIFSYNSSTNEVIWNVGSILPDIGSGSTKKIYFQLEFLPSSSQIGQAPILLGETSLSGIDKVTGLKLNAKAEAVTTTYSNDPSFKGGDDRVVE
ncbi:MAG: hypothetical protein A2431_03175 [Candidatus Zambryskibacteria bacterium RIFOXYC1_FULL_39_10]|uniref:DUF11 domain-containing protein n=1 Tax=Candidatus Zambryskibacteria bacterium RIFOXYC1_FULL_39_10 TaxID=1802779 RepID=A0A1G2V084_9BACT|nr:MAG: hypothetical protein A2605_01895 [Candidatus Zambryskibacteria bacterium RIFOXYD1_FULL_39_35]OHB15020.1 MAG: hypothetical protein A2431_03175 [Candidatus Zambryskibacteria bacterium RIFOXYC1_FULL_39_10]